MATLAGAAPHTAVDWHSIPWKKVYRTVRQLQARIVKAVQEGRWHKVKALAYLLTHSYSGRALAILRVVSNSGARTPGVDGILWHTPAAKSEAFHALRRFLKERGLELSPEKTRITHLEDGFDFLGQTLRRQRKGKVLIKPSKRSVKTFLAKIQETIDHSGSMTAGEMIRRLNQPIKGWTMYHRFVVSGRIFAAVDNRIYWKLRRWCRKRHRNKSWKWIKKKYFPRAQEGDGAFTAVIVDRKGKGWPIRLIPAAGSRYYGG